VTVRAGKHGYSVENRTGRKYLGPFLLPKPTLDDLAEGCRVAGFCSHRSPGPYRLVTLVGPKSTGVDGHRWNGDGGAHRVKLIDHRWLSKRKREW